MAIETKELALFRAFKQDGAISRNARRSNYTIRYKYLGYCQTGATLWHEYWKPGSIYRWESEVAGIKLWDK